MFSPLSFLGISSCLFTAILNLICNCSLGFFDPERPIIEYFLIIQLFDCLICILDILIENVREAFRAIRLRVFYNLYVLDWAKLDENSPQIIPRDPFGDARNINVITYTKS